MSEIIGTSCALTMPDGRDITFCLYEDAVYVCPECGETKLKFEHGGYWD